MNTTSVNEIQTLMNQEIAFQETLNERLLEAEALMRVAVASPFDELTRTTIYHYLWALGDLIFRARALGEQSLDVLLKLDTHLTR